jgi:AcrR family transcriptional regulator
MADQKAQRRERILAATRDLIAERGYREVTMRSIAERCEVSVPTLYNLCGDRQVLLFEAVSSHFTDLLFDTSGAGHKRAHNRVLAIAETCSEEMCRLPEYHRALLGVLVGSDAAQDLSASLTRILAAEMQVGLEEMRSAGDLANWADPAVLAQSVAGQLVITSFDWASGRLPDTGLRAGMVYGTSMLLLGVSSGRAATVFGRRARACQADALATGTEPTASGLDVMTA